MRNIQFGIIGNMGPEADLVFQDRIRTVSVRRGAKTDQEHIGVVIVRNPDIPDRSQAINEGGADPVPELLNAVRALEKNHVQYAVMSCNTAHFFRERVQKKTDILLLDMLKETVNVVQADHPNAKVGLLATTGTCNTGIYDQYLQTAKIDFAKPDAISQENHVHSAIYGERTGEKTPDGKEIRKPEGIKAGKYAENAERLAQAIEILQQEKGVNTIILGCTELPLVQDRLEARFPHIAFLDPMQAVAEKAVALYHVAQEKYAALPEKKILPQPHRLRDVKTFDEQALYIAVKAKTARRPLFFRALSSLRAAFG